MTRYYITPVRPLGPRQAPQQHQPHIPQQAQALQQQLAPQQLQVPQGLNAQPVQPIPQPAMVQEIDFTDPLAILGRPKTLLELWHEWLFGLNGNKPAKNFSPRERGKQKHKYSKRKHFWGAMIKLIRAGYNELTAIDLIKQAYGVHRSVSQILASLQNARNHGWHPLLADILG